MRPDAVMLMLKFDAGNWPFPRLWNGPPKLSEIGPLRVREPDGFTVRLRFRLPLVTVCEPLNVCLSRLFASVPELLPHALSPIAAEAISSAPARRIPLIL